MSKYSYSLDVGKDLDDELNVPKGLEKYEREFKELVEEPQSSKEPEQKVEPEKKDAERKETPKKEVEKKEVKRELPKKEPEKKEVKKPVAKVVKKPEPVRAKPKVVPKARPVERAKPAVTKASPSKPVPHAPKTIPAASSVQTPQSPNYQSPQTVPPGRWPLAILVSVIVIAGLFYFFQTISAADVPAGEFCTTNYIKDQSGVQLVWDTANSAQRKWLRDAFITHESAKAAEILNMLACKDAKITETSDPAAYLDCKTSAIYVSVTPKTYSDLAPEASRSSMLAGLSNPKSQFKRFFTVAYATEDPKIVSWRVTP